MLSVNDHLILNYEIAYAGMNRLRIGSRLKIISISPAYTANDSREIWNFFIFTVELENGRVVQLKMSQENLQSATSPDVVANRLHKINSILD